MSFRLGTVVGIPIRIHWLFAVLVILIVWRNGAKGGSPAVIETLTLIGILFGSVVLHEFGHALSARRFGARIVDITLWPLGGLTRMTQMPERAFPEVVVALAGPAVNAALLGLGVLFGAHVALPWRTGDTPILTYVEPTHLDVMASVNFALAFFNLAPAFPMDGGRALRGALSSKFGYLQATEIAVRIGRWFAVAAVLAAWFYTDMFAPILLIGVFLWIQGAQELADVRARYGINPLQAAFQSIFRMRVGGKKPREEARQDPDTRPSDSTENLPKELENYRGSMEEFFRQQGRRRDEP